MAKNKKLLYIFQISVIKRFLCVHVFKAIKRDHDRGVSVIVVEHTDADLSGSTYAAVSTCSWRTWHF